MDHTVYLAGCQGCRLKAKLYMRDKRARKRGLRPVPSLPEPPASASRDMSSDGGTHDMSSVPEPDGAVVAALRRDLAKLGSRPPTQWWLAR
ncbi:MAG TPA: hypothetical protein VMU34_26210 [Mycobacterium sp.]|nr:hypothetical protein [Mycobacterium sp.]